MWLRNEIVSTDSIELKVRWCWEGRGKTAFGASVVLSLVVCFLGQIQGGGVIASFLLFRHILAQI